MILNHILNFLVANFIILWQTLFSRDNEINALLQSTPPSHS